MQLTKRLKMNLFRTWPLALRLNHVTRDLFAQIFYRRITSRRTCTVCGGFVDDGGGGGHGVRPKSTGGGQNKLWSVFLYWHLTALGWGLSLNQNMTLQARLAGQGALGISPFVNGTLQAPQPCQRFLYRCWGFKVTSSFLESKCSYPLNHLSSLQKTEKPVMEDQMNNS